MAEEWNHVDRGSADGIITELGSRIGAGVCGSLLARLGANVVVPEAERTDEGKRAHREQLMAGERSMSGSSRDTLLLERLVAATFSFSRAISIGKTLPAGAGTQNIPASFAT